MFKTCKLCKEEKLSTEFRRDKSLKSGRSCTCKVCARAKGRSDYVTKYNQKSNPRNKVRSERIKQVVDQYRIDNPCICCGETSLCCLDFHHLDPSEKDFNLSAYRNASLQKVLDEIAKCVVVCRNCHAKIHAGIINLGELSGLGPPAVLAKLLDRSDTVGVRFPSSPPQT